MIATWAGLRPLIAAPPNVDESEISREHEVFTRNDGLVIIAGGKLTTYRRMAREAVDETLKLLDELGEAVAVTSAHDQGAPTPRRRGPRAARSRGRRRDRPPLMAARPRRRHRDPPVRRVRHARAADRRAISADRALGERLDPELPVRVGRDRVRGDATISRAPSRTCSRRRVPLLLVSRDQGLGVVRARGRPAAAIHGWTADAAHPDARRVPGRGRAQPSVDVADAVTAAADIAGWLAPAATVFC